MQTIPLCYLQPDDSRLPAPHNLPENTIRQVLYRLHATAWGEEDEGGKYDEEEKRRRKKEEEGKQEHEGQKQEA